jgi:hypothetical protein
MTEQVGFRVKTPFDIALIDIFKGRKKACDRVEKGYFVQLQNQNNIKFLEFSGMEVKPIFPIVSRKKLAKGSRFNLDVSFTVKY